MLEPEVLAARLILGTIFLIAGLNKVSSLASFSTNILEYRLISKAQAEVVAHILPVLEIVLGIFCITGVFLREVSLLDALLLVIFTGAIFINLLSGRRFRCHCFASSQAIIGPILLLRNFLLLIISLFLGAQCFFFSPFNALTVQWSLDVQILLNPLLLAPIIAIVLLSITTLFLLNETGTVYTI